MIFSPFTGIIITPCNNNNNKTAHLVLQIDVQKDIDKQQCYKGTYEQYGNFSKIFL